MLLGYKLFPLGRSYPCSIGASVGFIALSVHVNSIFRKNRKSKDIPWITCCKLKRGAGQYEPNVNPVFHPIADAANADAEALVSGSDTTMSGTELGASKGLIGAADGGGGPSMDAMASSAEGGGRGAGDISDGSSMEGGTLPEGGRGRGDG